MSHSPSTHAKQTLTALAPPISPPDSTPINSGAKEDTQGAGLVSSVASVHSQDDDPDRGQHNNKSNGYLEGHNHFTPTKASRLIAVEAAHNARDNGSTQPRAGAAQSHPAKSKGFRATIAEIIQEARQKTVEVCMTLGMLNQNEAEPITPNHNLDTS